MSLGNWTSREISQGKLPVLGGGQRRIYRCGVRMSMGVPVRCLVTHATPALYPVSVRRFRRPVMGFLQIRPRGRHPCLDGRFRSLRPVEDFHLLNWQHAWRTRRRPIKGRLFHAQDRGQTIVDSPEKSSDSAKGAAKSAAIDPELADLVKDWPSLPTMIKSAILAVARPHMTKV
jgi:hypothetical protein